MSTEQNKALVRHVLEETWRGNLDILNDHPGMHETIPFITALTASVKFSRQEIVQQLTDGDWVITRFVSQGKVLKDFMGVPAGTENQVETIMMHLIQNGTIVEQHAQGGPINTDGFAR